MQFANRTRFVYRQLPLAVLACLSFNTGSAHAKVFSAHEEAIAHVADLSKEWQKKLATDDGAKFTTLGYKFHYTEVLWVNFWTWGGEWCIFDPQETDLARSKTISSWRAAEYLGIEKSELTKPFQYKFPPGVLVLGGLMIVYAGFKILWPEEVQVKRLFADERYQRAVTIVQESAKAESTTPADQLLQAGFTEGVLYLESQGIHRDVAEENLGKLVRALAVHPNADAERKD